VAKYHGIAGIVFSSSRHYDSNLVIFERDTPFEFVGEPELFKIPDYFSRFKNGLFYIQGFPLLA